MLAEKFLLVLETTSEARTVQVDDQGRVNGRKINLISLDEPDAAYPSDSTILSKPDDRGPASPVVADLKPSERFLRQSPRGHIAPGTT